jgi:hypothetical protein
MFDLTGSSSDNWNQGQTILPFYSPFKIKTCGGSFDVHITSFRDPSLPQHLLPFTKNDSVFIKFTQLIPVTILIATYEHVLWIMVDAHPFPDFVDMFNHVSQTFYIYDSCSPDFLVCYGFRFQFRPVMFSSAQLAFLDTAFSNLINLTNVNFNGPSVPGSLAHFLFEFRRILCILIAFKPAPLISCPICDMKFPDCPALFPHFVQNHQCIPAHPELIGMIALKFYCQQLLKRLPTMAIAIHKFVESQSFYQCPICVNCDRSVSASLRHFCQAHFQGTSQLFFPGGVCPFCHKELSLGSDAINHYSDDHPEELVTFLCQQVPPHLSAAVMAYGMAVRQPPAVHFCPFCSAGSLDPQMMRDHISNAHAPDPTAHSIAERANSPSTVAAAAAAAAAPLGLVVDGRSFDFTPREESTIAQSVAESEVPPVTRPARSSNQRAKGRPRDRAIAPPLVSRERSRKGKIAFSWTTPRDRNAPTPTNAGEDSAESAANEPFPSGPVSPASQMTH